MCGLFLTGPESRSVFEEARSLEVLTPGTFDRIQMTEQIKNQMTEKVAKGPKKYKNPKMNITVLYQIFPIFGPI